MKSVRPSEGLRRAYQHLAAEFGASITLPQTALLGAMRHGSKNQTELVDASGIDRSTLSTMLQVVVRRGYAVVVPCDKDKRAKRVAITPAGRTALTKADRALFEAEAKVLRLVPAADRPAFLRCLRAIAEAP